MGVLPPEISDRLEDWNGRPDLLGAWLDLALDERAEWTEIDLIQRWRRLWSAEKSRAWIGQAVDAGLLIPKAEGQGYGVWQADQAGSVSATPKEIPSGESADEETIEPDGSDAQSEVGVDPRVSPLGFEAFVESLAQALIDHIPALGSLEGLEQLIAAVRGTGVRIEFDLENLLPLEDLERAYVSYVLEEFEGNRTRTAEALGIDPSTLYRKFNRWGLG